MNDYENVIISKLLIKYENSKISKNGSDRNLTISLVFNEKNMPDYVGEFSYKYEKLIENAVNSLKNKNLIDVCYDFDKRIDRVILNLDNIDNCYRIIKKDSISLRREKIYEVLNRYSNKGKLVQFFKSKIELRLNNYLSNKKYFKNEIELEEILLILDKLDNQKVEISRRSFSSLYLNDSKRLESLLSKIESIIRECDDLDYEDVLVNYNVYKNPSFVYLKGIGTFKVNNQIIDLESLDSELILSSNHIKVLEVVSLNCKEVITVENLDTFYMHSKNDRCVIYLGGFHNEIRKILLCKLYDFNNSLCFYHSGDIDAGGFYILRHLINDTKINFKAKLMDVETLEKYKDKCMILTDLDKKRLELLKNDSLIRTYKDVIDYMLVNNVKLEQENIFYD